MLSYDESLKILKETEALLEGFGKVKRVLFNNLKKNILVVYV